MPGRHVVFELDRDGYCITVQKGIMVEGKQRGVHHQGETWEAFVARVLAAVDAFAAERHVPPERIIQSLHTGQRYLRDDFNAHRKKL